MAVEKAKGERAVVRAIVEAMGPGTTTMGITIMYLLARGRGGRQWVVTIIRLMARAREREREKDTEKVPHVFAIGGERDFTVIVLCHAPQNQSRV
mmetsp:Transcript_18313/g.18132  ORF Transcript_18313/g.18132 Transcript_18313/m.18132 type:complete len:95 (-) Transcript_18313:34-318(-)